MIALLALLLSLQSPQDCASVFMDYIANPAPPAGQQAYACMEPS